jgi:cyclohexadienyl dehydratase
MSRYLRLVGILLLFPVLTSQAEDRSLMDGPALVRRVLTVLDARIALMPDVAAAKWIAHQPVGDPAREVAVVQSATEQAVALGLSREPVERLLSAQIARARLVQTAAMDRWQRTDTGPTAAPSLRDELRPRIDQLTHDLLTALYLAAPFLSEVDVDALADGLPDARWSPTDRHELAAALRAVRFDGPRTPERMRRAGILRIGLPADYAPFASTHDGRLIGADVELTTQLAHAMGLTPVYERSSWASLMTDLAADHFDIAGGGISVTEARRAHALFSPPLVNGGKTAIGRCTDRHRFQTLSALDTSDVRVIENPGGTNEQFARRHLPHARLTVHTDNLTVFQEIVAGRADVMITDDIEIARVTRHETRLCRLLKDVYEPVDKALLLPPEAAWLDAIEPALRPLLANEAYGTLLDAAAAE